MRKKTGIAVTAITVMTMLLSACAGIPGMDSLNGSSQASEEAGEEPGSQADDPEADSGQDSAADDHESGDEAGREQSGSTGRGNGKIDLKGSDRSQSHSGGEIRIRTGGKTGGDSIEADPEETDASEEQEESGDEETDSYTLGVTTDEGWESEYWNLRYTAPEGLYMLNKEGLDALMGLSEELAAKNYTERQREYLKLTTLYEMMSMTLANDANVGITVEKLYVKGMETEEYKKAALLHLRLMQEPVYEILDDSGTAEIAGETYAVVNTRVESNDVCLQDYYFRVEGERAMIIVITYTEETADTAGAILNGFGVY